MPRYSEERKASTLKKLLPPQNRSVSSVAVEDGISPQTLYHWLKQCREQGVAVPGHRKQSEQWSADDKLAVVIETAGLSEAELAAYCREKGLFAEQIKQWRHDCLQGFGRTAESEREARQARKKTAREIKQLKAEVRRKDKALAETTALLVLSKKLEALYGNEPDNEDD
ncbi:hypothetical protein CWE15_11960 [Aliidiomarina taiwanensis]|uniref:Transposase n=1 Tax=Aliidiomarina taiwanensis TaxID=946228 RepID=A0A432WQI1_9GAMM|nr:transposase [Aliidiomarina taiwanensis]RUO36062.1 hypothetical protein CWE15_11960 [Aliidiomarina taiwanensis]